MSAPAPSPAPPATPPAGRGLTPLRLLGIAAFAAVGFVAIWQGFGLAGFGTDAHVLRVIAVVVVLVIHGRILVWPPATPAGRVLAVIVGLGIASGMWWIMTASPDGLRLREAVAERDRLKQQFATPLIDDIPSARKVKASVDVLDRQYPSLAGDLRAGYVSWMETAQTEFARRYGDLRADDVAGAKKLAEQTAAVGEFDREAASQMEPRLRRWVEFATDERKVELTTLQHADWAEFNRTAPGRHALVQAFPEAKPSLAAGEEQWVTASTEFVVRFKITTKTDGPPNPPTRASWLDRANELRALESAILALKSLDTTDARFKAARKRLFTVAHDAAKVEATAHIAAGKYDLAFGVARTHAVEWNATASILGADELKKLDSLRETCEVFDKLASKAAKPPEAPDTAPPPRTKP